MSPTGWTIRGILGVFAWAALGLAPAEAQVTIPPMDPVTRLPIGGPVTVSIFKGGMDVTGGWLPEPGETVQIVVNGLATPPAISLVCSDGSLNSASTCPDGSASTANPIAPTPVLRTSSYPGQCTNFDNPSPLTTYASDFQLSGGNLTSTDCGGMAVIVVNPGPGELKFILPQDSNFNGIPDIWESTHLPPGMTSLAADGDIDAGPAATSPCCDGIANFDEYRGFIVSLADPAPGVVIDATNNRKHIRTDPRVKDLFLHLVNPADSVGGVFVVSASCGTSCLGGGTTTYPTPTAPTATLTLGASGTFTTGSSDVFSIAHVGGEIIGNAVGRARIVAVTGPTSVTAEITQSFGGATSLGPGTWKVSESLFANVYSLVPPARVHLLGYAPGTTNLLTDQWVDNFLSLTPPQTLNTSDPVTDRTVNRNRLYGPPQKGVRIMEGLNVDLPSTLGWSYGIGSPNLVGNIDLFTQRIVNYITGLITAAAPDLVRYSTFVNGAWTTPTLVGDGNPANLDVSNFILSKAIQFYVGMEVGHTLDLTPTVMGTQKTSYGYHQAPGSGDCLDQAITTKVKSGFNTFYIPSLCGSADQSQFLIK